jgi:hypothetical protein
MDQEFKKFRELVKELRTAQKNYFHFRGHKIHQQANDWLTKCKELEKQVDKKIKDLESNEQAPKLL